MSGTAKRLTLTISIAALVAVIAGSAMAPEPAAAAAKKPRKPATEFRITTDEDIWGPSTGGTWESSGALEGWGEVFGGSSSATPLQLHHHLGPDVGEMVIEWEAPDTKNGTFVVVVATGAYESLLGAHGSYSARWNLTKPKKGQGWPAYWGTVRRTLDGAPFSPGASQSHRPTGGETNE